MTTANKRRHDASMSMVSLSETSMVSLSETAPMTTNVQARRLFECLGQQQRPTLIGKGSRGVVYGLDSGRVLKITDDRDEAQSMAIVAANPHPAVVRVDRVLRVSKDRWGIVQEYLQPARPTWYDFGNRVNDALHPKGWKKIKNVRLLPARTGYWVSADQIAYQARATPAQAEWLADVAAYLYKVGIAFHDLHGGNIMRAGTQHKLIDLGYSRSVPAARMPIQSMRQTCPRPTRRSRR